MKFFHDLLHHPSSLILTNLFGLLKPFPCLQDLEESFLELQKGQQFSRDKLLEILRGYGYVKEDLVVSAGEYAWRGGVVDVFSPWEKFPLRIEFRGDEISSLRHFDPSTQSSVEKLDEVLIPSLREFPSSMQFLEEWRELARKNSR